MNRITRLLAIAGMGVGAAIALAGPAQAATGTASHATSASSKADWNNSDDVVGYFDSRGICERVGRSGEFRDSWDDYDCYRVRFGFHRGDWALSVDDNDWNGPRDFHHGGPFGGPFGGGFHGPHGGGHGPIFFPFHPAAR
jgi:hypothetical protein